MRSIWNGAISFGLVSIPIKLVNATESHSISFRQIHLSDSGRVRYRKVCELDGEEVSSAEIGKGYEEADGSVIPITDEDLAQLPIATAKTIEIVSFVPADEIDPLQMDSAYYLAANGATAAKPYTLLREALKRSRKVAIAKYALRGRERLGMLRVVDDVIAMHGLLWPDEIRVPEGVAPEGAVSVREAELDLADALMATLGEVEMASLHDDYREAVEAMIAAKAGGGAPAAAAGPPEAGGQVIDLMAALENSVRAAKASRAGSAAGSVAEPASGDRPSADVTPIRRKRTAASGAAAPKASGGKKSTASSSAGAAGSKATGGKKSTASAAKKTSKTTAAKSTARTTAKTTASGAARKTTSAKAQAQAQSQAGSTAKKTAAPRKRSSA
ncbi:non-homologous end joining protein Ku [Streptomyces sp. NPDC054961]